MQIGLGADGPIAGRRVVVTGLGVMASCGIGVDSFWSGLFEEPELGIRRISGFDPTELFGPKEVRRVDRFAQFAVAVADMALTDAGPLDVDPDRAGVVFASGVGGLETLEAQIVLKEQKGERRVSPFLIPMMMANAAAGHVSIRTGWHGPCESVVTACAAGTQAIAAAARLIAMGRCEVAIGGGSEAALTSIGIAAFTNMTALSKCGVSCPFDERRDGFVMGEGAGALILEELDHAIARGAKIYAELLGSASTADAHHMTAPTPGGAGAASCMEIAIADSFIAPGDVGHINAHGTSTQLNDLAEAEAIAKVFDSPGPPVTSTKGVTGHTLGAAGAIEAVTTVLTIEKAVIPPTGGFENLDPQMDIDVVHGAGRPWTPSPAISNSFGFGGHNGCLVFAPHSS